MVSQRFWSFSRGVRGLVVAASLLLLCIGGCKQPSVKSKTEIRSIHMAGVYAEAARTLAAEFEQQTGVHVRIVAAPLLSLREKEVTDLLTQQDDFDVMQVPHQWEGEILPHLLPLEGSPVSAQPDLSDFIPTVRNNCGRWEGQMRGIPMACDLITLLYRTDIFAARSAEFQTLTGRPLLPPKTWQEYLEIARFLNSETLYGNIIMGVEQNFTVWSGILFGMGGRLVDDAWHPRLNSVAGAQSLSLFAEMFNYAPPGSESLNFTEANALFLQGRGAMYLTWPSLLWAQLQDTNICKITGKIGAAVIPGGKPQLSAWCLGINPFCKHPEQARKWIEFFTNQSNSKRLMLQYGKGSPRISTYQDPECKEKILYLSDVLAGFAGNEPRLKIPPSQELSDYMDLQILKVIHGEFTPQAALDRTAARWAEILTQTGYLKR